MMSSSRSAKKKAEEARPKSPLEAMLQEYEARLALQDVFKYDEKGDIVKDEKKDEVYAYYDDWATVAIMADLCED
jgi:hypothetical protein